MTDSAQAILPTGREVFDVVLDRVRRRFPDREVVGFYSRLLPETRAALEAIADLNGETMVSVLHRLVDAEAARVLRR